MTETVKVYNPNDGITGRDGGPYLDIEEAKAREARSAAREGRNVNKNDTPRGMGIPEKTQREIMDRRYIPGSLGGDVKQDELVEKHLEKGNVGELKVNRTEFTTTHDIPSLDLDESDDKSEAKTSSSSSSGTKDK